MRSIRDRRPKRIRDVSAAAELLGLGWDAAHAIMQCGVERGLNSRDLDGILYVGIDEKSFGRGQDSVSIMTDPDKSRAIDVVPQRTETATNALWNSLTELKRSGIEAVSIDLWAAYENSIHAHALQADIVDDNVHIVKHLNKAVDKVRRDEHRELSAQGDTRLTGTRMVWLYHPESLSETRAAELEVIRRQQLRTCRAWGLKDCIRWFWQSSDASSAKSFFADWYSWAIRSRLDTIKRVARMLRTHLDGLLAHLVSTPDQ